MKESTDGLFHGAVVKLLLIVPLSKFEIGAVINGIV